MCGILFLANAHHHEHQEQQSEQQLPAYWHNLCHASSRRGPHAQSTRQVTPAGTSLNLTLASSVLSLRGDGITEQPLCSPDESLILAWNGQIYDIHPDDDSPHNEPATRAQEQLKRGENDGRILMSWLREELDAALQADSAALPGAQASPVSQRTRALERALHRVLASIEAEWALVLVDAQSGIVYYGRDPLGRRSLLLSRPSGSLLLASVPSQEALAAGLHFEEVDCSSLWKWSAHTSGQSPVQIQSRAPARPLLTELRAPNGSPSDDPLQASFPQPTPAQAEEALDRVHAALMESIAVRARLVQGQAAKELQGEPMQASGGASAPLTAILFSGGLDSSLLAWYAHLSLPGHQTIDLINVAFENPRVLKAAAADQRPKAREIRAGAKASGDEATQRAPLPTSRFNTPDRLLSRVTRDQLVKLAPERPWNLLEVDVSYDDYLAHKDEITATMHPSDSVMDLSLASVLFFASRGKGRLSRSSIASSENAQPDSPYETRARVYLSGLGADELFGGYSRHRKAYTQAGENGEPGWYAVAKELQMDLDRLPTRNLGRDDRILSSHGREARYPFLSLPFIHLVADLPLRVKLDMELPQGEGDKLLLRALARRCGLDETAKEKKRAMQWGARSAKMEAGQGKIKGHHRLETEGVASAKRADSSPKRVIPVAVADAASHADTSAYQQTTGSEAGSEPPAEVFTTLCYFSKPPLPGQTCPVQVLLPVELRETGEDLAAHLEGCDPNSDAPAGKPLMHPLYAHIPLLPAHLIRLQTARRALLVSFPSSAWDADVAFPSLESVLEALADALRSAKEADANATSQSQPIHDPVKRRVRVAISARGEISITQARMASPARSVSASASAPERPALPKVCLDTHASGDAQPETLYTNKTSSRDVYDQARLHVGADLGIGGGTCFDVLMWSWGAAESTTAGEPVGDLREQRERRWLTESSIANILVEDLDAPAGRRPQFLTPRLCPSPTSGASPSPAPSHASPLLLPGLMRSYCVANGLAREADIEVEDLLADVGATGRRRRIWLCNALRGVWEVELER